MLQTTGQPLTACYSTLTSLPPAGCSGATIVGASASDIPGATEYPNGTVTTPTMHLVGTYQDGTLTLIAPPTRSTPVTPAPARDAPQVSCPAPVGGWPFDKVNQAGLSRVADYVNAQPDGGFPSLDDSQRIMTAPFVGDLERHRSELAGLYDGPVCVEQTRASQRDLVALETQVTAEAKQKGYGLLSSGSGNAFGTASVMVVAANDDDREALSQEHAGLVDVESFLSPTG